MGVAQITVSSLDMASYFHQHGWNDITLAVPVNLGQQHEIAELAPQLQLNLLVDSLETAKELDGALDAPCPVWVKVDVGYGRVGIKWDKPNEILALVIFLETAPHLDFAGLLTHSGHTYDYRGKEEVVTRFEEGRTRMLNLKYFLQNIISRRKSLSATPLLRAWRRTLKGSTRCDPAILCSTISSNRKSVPAPWSRSPSSPPAQSLENTKTNSKSSSTEDPFTSPKTPP